MEILGLAFAGSATPHRAAMSTFLRDVLGLTTDPAAVEGADLFALPDGSGVAVADEREPGEGTSRTVGFRVRDITAAVAELRRAGVGAGDVQDNDRNRYTHFTAPDRELYELVETR
jgi:catechol 2,3-dioxygenase-like lactoylglutathione lyase family enzyme